MRLVVVSGLSGAGKSVAMHALEDLGYYCVDNLPLALLPALAEQLQGSLTAHNERAVAVIDARNTGADFAGFQGIVEAIRARGVEVEVVFLEADRDVLIKRFSETRRRHPLTSGELGLEAALDREREMLAPVRDHADIAIDTTARHLHQLRELVQRRVHGRGESGLSLQFESFGFKHGVPSDTDFVFDARCLPNPHWEPELRALNGRDEAVARFLGEQALVREMTADVIAFLDRWIPAFEADNRSYLSVAIGCTGGQHRSVYLAERIAEHFRASREGVLLHHRELDP